MRHAVANNAGCPRQDWKSGIEIVWGFGKCLSTVSLDPS